MLKNLLLIGSGGFLGSIARYLTALAMARQFPTAFPLGTLMANLAGCFLIGVIYGLSDRGHVLTPEARIFLATGFCGGYTTFSTFSYENITLLQSGAWLNMGLYLAISVMGCFTATYLGLLFIRLL